MKLHTRTHTPFPAFYNINSCLQTSPRLLTKKSSSCSTIFIDDSTVSQPNLKSTVKWYNTMLRSCSGGEITLTTFYNTLQQPTLRSCSGGEITLPTFYNTM